MSANCGCCACLAGAGAHVDIENRPGLSALRYRAGTYSSFRDAMIRRLSVPHEASDPYSLHALTTREPDDPAIALLDAWAVTGDVLTFYQERIANEGFLRTATERRSMLELGRLVGYTLKPGVSASVYLAYTVDDSAITVIPAGSKAQSIPGAGEQPKTFETQEDIDARGVWNALKPRLSKPQTITLENILTLTSTWIDGTTTKIDAGEPLLFVFDWNKTPVYALRRAVKATIDTERKRTEVALDPVRPYYTELFDAVLARIKVLGQSKEMPPAPAKKSKKKAPESKASIPPTELQLLHAIANKILLGIPRSTIKPQFENSQTLSDDVKAKVAADDRDFGTPPPPPPFDAGVLVGALASRAALAPASQWQYVRTLSATLSRTSDQLPRILTSFLPQLGTNLYAALAQSTTGKRPQAQFRSVHVLRKRTAPFGYNAPTVLFEDRTSGTGAPAVPASVNEEDDAIFTESPIEALKAGSYVVIRTQDNARVQIAREVDQLTRSAYAISGKTTRIGLDLPWASFADTTSTTDSTRLGALKNNLAQLRPVTVLTQSEELTLAQMPLDRVIGLAAGSDSTESETRIELDTVIEGMKPGRWVIVTGERDDTSGSTGVIAGELAMVANVELVHDAGIGGTAYSALELAPEGLKYHYKRATVKIYGNVAKADHGDTRFEILGGGNAAEPLQTFTLKQTPLTFVSAPTPAGVASTLAVRINDVLWHPIDTFMGSEANDRVYVTKTADDGKVSITFGNGREGSRVPTGNDNVRAMYRTGIGKAGNVRPKQIATAISRPLGVKDVVNPLKASGGADPESRDDARRNIPVSLQSMGRVVSVRDFADFARTFGGIGKATAIALSDGRARVVHLTVGGAGDIDVEVTSDLYRNLVEALRAYGDPYQPFVVQPREKLVVAGSANVRIDPDYLWTSVAPVIRAKLLDVFSYDRRDLGQVLFPAEVVAAIQSVPGVTYVDLDALGGIAQSDIVDTASGSAPGKIIGDVNDGDNDEIPGATITATNIQTKAALTATSNANGRFSIVVPAGEYELKVELDGFTRVHRTGAYVRGGATILEAFVMQGGSTPVEDTSTNGPITTSFNAPAVNGVAPVVPQLARLEKNDFHPAQIAYIPPELADLFILTEIKDE